MVKDLGIQEKVYLQPSIQGPLVFTKRKTKMEVT